MYNFLVSFLLLIASGSAAAATPSELQASLAAQAKAANPGFTGFDAARGRTFFADSHGGDWRCSTCHTANPANVGKHEVTGKLIKPLAPAANAERFTRPDKVEKWFKRNCNDVLKRNCTAQEKGDLLTYLLSVQG